MLGSVRDTIAPTLPLAMVAALLFAATSCSSSVEPRSGVTLLVTNETCAAGHCDSLEVLDRAGVHQPAAPAVVQDHRPTRGWHCRHDDDPVDERALVRDRRDRAVRLPHRGVSSPGRLPSGKRCRVGDQRA